MKSEYRLYGRDCAQLDEILTARERKLLDDFLTLCRTTAGEGKVRDYRRYVLQFRDVAEKPLNEITREDCIAFWALVQHSPHEVNTKVTIRRIVKRFLKWHYKDLSMIEPLKNGNFVVNRRKINKATLLKPHEFQLMLHRAERIRDKAILVLLYETAARPHEIRDLRWRDVNWDESEVHLFCRKTGEDRDPPIQEALKHLRRWKQEWVFPDVRDEDFIFPSITGSRPNRDRPVSVSYIERIIKSLGDKAGIQRRIYPYLLRHTRLTEIHRKGVQGIEHNKFAGHVPGSRQQATYVHLNNEDMKQALLEKVYNIQELEEKTDKRVQVLTDELKRTQSEIKEIRELLERTIRNLRAT